MKTDYFREIHRYSHEDDRRYQLLMRGLRIIQEEKQGLGRLQKLKRQWAAKKRKVSVKQWDPQ